MSENDPRPAESPYGSQPPTNPYGQPVPPASGESSSGSPHDTAGGQSGQPTYPPAPPYGQTHEQPASPYGQPQHGQQQGYPQHGQPYGQQQGYPQQGYPQGYPQQQPAGAYAAAPYGGHRPSGDRRPGTVTAAAWTAIVMSALSALLFGVMTLAFLVAQEPILREMERAPEFRELDVDAGSIMGLIVAVMVVFLLWSIIGIVLGVFVLKRSNVARILLVISSAMVALISLPALAGGGGSAVTLVAAAAVIVLLFVGGANQWFSRSSGPQAATPYGGTHQPYGGEQPSGGTHQPYGGGDQPYDPDRR